MAPLTITVNGRPHAVASQPDTPLLYVLRNELELNGPKFGCGLGQCGSCTVLLGDRAVRSCLMPVSAAAASPITTLEGLSKDDKLHPLQEAFIAEQALQCGYCIGGMIMTAAALLAKTPKPSPEAIRTALRGNLCRCGAHLRIVRAIERAANGGVSPASSGRGDA